LGGKTKAKNESSSPALLPAEWKLSKKKSGCKRKIRQYLEAQIFRVYQIPTASHRWKMRGNMAFKQFSTMLPAYFPIYAKQKSTGRISNVAES